MSYVEAALAHWQVARMVQRYGEKEGWLTGTGGVLTLWQAKAAAQPKVGPFELATKTVLIRHSSPKSLADRCTYLRVQNWLLLFRGGRHRVPIILITLQRIRTVIHLSLAFVFLWDIFTIIIG